MRRFAIVAGARPNFIKIAPLLRALKKFDTVEVRLIHTGQHYDSNLSDVFFQELEIAQPDVSLGIGSGTHGQQTGRLIESLEQEFMAAAQREQPLDRLIVVGDVNSTMAAAIAAAKLNIPVAHVEAGLRSFDRTMPEEINRLVTDAISDLLFVSEESGRTNLLNEGHSPASIHVVGNVMIDTLRQQLERAGSSAMLPRLGLTAGSYAVVTLHRPANVDCKQTLQALVEVLKGISCQLPIVFPIHPRTRTRFTDFGLLPELESAASIKCLPPIGYLDFLSLTSQAKVIVTDSGGLQEEATALGIPCLTMRSNTERPITVREGTSTLIGSDAGKLEAALRDVLNGSYKQGRCPDLWDGKAAERIAKILAGGE